MVVNIATMRRPKDGKPAADTIPGCFTVKKTIPTNKGFLFPDGSFKQYFTSPLFSIFNSCNVNIVFYRQEDVWVCGEHTIPARDNASPCEEIDPEEFEWNGQLSRQI